MAQHLHYGPTTSAASVTVGPGQVAYGDPSGDITSGPLFTYDSVACTLSVDNSSNMGSGQDPGLRLRNTHLADDTDTEQYSPAFVFSGSSWLTTTDVLHTSDMMVQYKVYEATTAAGLSNELVFSMQDNGGGYTNVLRFGTEFVDTFLTLHGAAGTNSSVSFYPSLNNVNMSVGGQLSLTVSRPGGSSITGFYMEVSDQGGFRTASTEVHDFYVALGANITQWSTGAISLQRFFRVGRPSMIFFGSSTVTEAATFCIDGAPTNGVGATITNSYALVAGLNTDTMNILGRNASWGNSTTAFWGHYANRGAAGGHALSSATTGLTTINASNQISQQIANTTRWQMVTGGAVSHSTASAAGLLTAFTLTPGAYTAVTLNTENTDVYFNLTRTVTWATGSSIGTQRFFRIGQPTVAFAGASTLANAYTVYVDGAPVAGTNATLTATYALGIGAGDISLLNGWTRFQTTTTGIAWTNGSISSSSNGIIVSPASGISLTMGVPVFGVPKMTVVGTAWTGAAGAGSEYNEIYFNTNQTKTFQTGAVTTQRFFRIGQPTMAFAAASTATNVYNVYIDGPVIQGTNATISNNWALFVGGNTSHQGNIVPNNNDTYELGGSGLRYQGVWVSRTLVIGGSTTAPANELSVTPVAYASNFTLSTEHTDVHFNLARTMTWATGAITTQRFFRVTNPTMAFAAASVVTDAYTMYVDGQPLAGTNATLTNSYALGVGGRVKIHTTVSTSISSNPSLWILANSGGNTHSGIVLGSVAVLSDAVRFYWDDANGAFLHTTSTNNLNLGANQTTILALTGSTATFQNCTTLTLAGTTVNVNVTNLGFYGVSAAVQQTSGANLTNNVTSGGTNNQIDDWTNLATYSTDAAAIRNAIYQLARKLKQINDGLRTYGLFT